MAESGAMAMLLELRSVAVNSFRVAGTAAALQTLVDRSVNAARMEGRLAVPSPDVWLHYVDGTVESGPRWPDASCRVLFVAIPVRRESDGQDAMYCPYVFVDRNCALLSRFRQDLGYPAWGGKIDVTNAAGRTRIVVRTDVYAAGDPAPHFDTEILTLDFARHPAVVSRTLSWQYPTTGLLQFRESSTTDRAVLHSPVYLSWEGSVASDEESSDIVVTAVPGFRNIDLASDLGLASGPQALAPDTCALGGAERILCTGPYDLRAATPPIPQPVPFVEPRIDPRAPAPFAFEDVSITGFQVTADPERLQFLVDALLNSCEELGQPRQYFRYRVATAEVVIEWLRYGAMRSVGPPTEWRNPEDYTTQHELAIRILVGKTEEDSNAAEAPQVFCPFLFVDNWTSMVSGREVLGLWKRIAQFGSGTQTAFDGTTERRLTVDEPSFGSIFSFEHSQTPAHQGRWHRPQGSRGHRGGVLPWGQHDFTRAGFRREFARHWFSLGGQQFGMIQRRLCPRPDGLEPLRDWIQMNYRVQSFQVALPSGPAQVRLGHFHDPELAALLQTFAEATGTGPLHGVDETTGRFDLTQVLGVQGGGDILLPPSGWYQSNGSFRLDVIDRMA